MNKSFNEVGVQFAWDATSISLAQTCLRKYQYKMIEGWSPRGLSVHLRFGAHYATALEHFYKWRALGDSVDEALVKTVREALINTWDYAPCPTCSGSGKMDFNPAEPGGTSECLDCSGTGSSDLLGAPWQSDHNTKTRETLIRTIVWYVDQFADEAITVVTTSEGKPAVEYTFTLPVDNGIIFSGHIDRLVNYADSIYVMDQKTTGSTISAKFFDDFSPNTQMSMYTFAGKMIYAMPVKGVIIDAASIMVGFTRYERGFTFRSDAQLAEWYDQAMHTIEYTQKMTAEQYFPMNPAACGNYGGCEFRRVCSRSPDVRKNFLAGDFEKGPSWDPLTRR